MRRRSFLAAGAAASLAAPTWLRAAPLPTGPLPTGPIRIVVGFAPEAAPTCWPA